MQSFLDTLKGRSGASRTGSGAHFRNRCPGAKTVPDRGLTLTRALHPLARLSRNRRKRVLFEVPFSIVRNPVSAVGIGHRLSGVIGKINDGHDPVKPGYQPNAPFRNLDRDVKDCE